MAKEIEITVNNFEEEVINSDKPVLIDFWATWCGPCKMQGPVFEAVAEENDGSVKFGKVNIDDNMEIAQKYGIMSIPTLVLFKDGKPAVQKVGFQQKNDVLEMIK